jgi:NAD(P)H-hydrate epimerase
MARLLGRSTADVQSDRLTHAMGLARRWRTTVVLKGAGTIITDGQRWAINRNGNPGMATGGTGDVLSGLLVALLAQGLEVFDAARLGVWLHGMAGDLAAAEWSEPGLIASDLPRFLGAAWTRALATR